MYNSIKKYNQIWLRNRCYSIVLILSLMLLSCKDTDDETTSVIEDLKISSFSFLAENNPSLNSDIHLTIEDDKVTGRLGVSVAVSELVGTIKHNASAFLVNGIEQVNSESANDFTDIVIYTLKSDDDREKTYEIDVTYFTGLPVFYIETDAGLPIDSTDDYREGSASIIGGRNYDDLEETGMKIRGRGHSTWYFHPKKPYQLKFSDETAIFDIPAEKKWIFLAEHSDKTLMRNKIAFEMGYLSVLDWTPNSTFSEVFINNSYNGTYHITQKVETGSSRVDIGETGYLLEIDNIDHIEEDDVIFYTGDFLINIKEPELVVDSNEYNFIKDYINEFENVLNSSQFDDPNIGYPKYIDIDTFIDWYLISEITKNQDSKSYSSIYLNVIPGEKIKMGPLWDFDLAFGNVDYSECEYPEGFWVKDHAWYARLFQDEAFVNKVKSRFLFFKQNQGFILNKIDDYAAYLKFAQQENNAKWNVIGNYVWPNPVVYNSYGEEVEHLKNWYTTRMNWLETAINNL